jgi:hypothetical protein
MQALKQISKQDYEIYLIDDNRHTSFETITKIHDLRRDNSLDIWILIKFEIFFFPLLLCTYFENGM